MNVNLSYCPTPKIAGNVCQCCPPQTTIVTSVKKITDNGGCDVFARSSVKCKKDDCFRIIFHLTSAKIAIHKGCFLAKDDYETSAQRDLTSVRSPQGQQPSRPAPSTSRQIGWHPGLPLIRKIWNTHFTG